MISKLCLILGTCSSINAVKTKGKCPFGYTSGKTAPDSELAQIGDDPEKAPPKYPSDILTCPKNKVMKTSSWTKS